MSTLRPVGRTAALNQNLSMWIQPLSPRGDSTEKIQTIGVDRKRRCGIDPMPQPQLPEGAMRPTPPER
jgi:hypothetical protein